MNAPHVSHRLDMGVVLPSIGTLPALPEVVFQLVRSLEDPLLDLGRLEQQVEMDQALSTKLLRVANSSFYGLLRQVGTVRDAAMVLGFGALRSMAIAAATVNHFATLRLPPDFHYRAFWSHGMACGLAAELLAREHREPEGVAFTAGLIHDIGRLVLASQFPSHLDACFLHKARTGCGLLDAEREVLGIAHPEIGAALARHWHFPVMVVDAIEFHHQPEPQRSSVAHIVHLADGLARGRVGVVAGEVVLGENISRESWARFAAPAAEIATIAISVNTP
jgi:putative nucleotidyltransferase with HDIG domain